MNNKFEIQEPRPGNKSQAAIDRSDGSLDKFFESPEASLISSELSRISTCDLVVANATKPSFEAAVHMFYASALGVPVIAFVDSGTEMKIDVEYSLIASTKLFSSYPELLDFLKETTAPPAGEEKVASDVLFNAIESQMRTMLSKEDRKDALFRAAILSTQVGQTFHYLTHDKTLNPGARPVGSRADEEAQLGDSLVQLMIYLLSRGFNIEKAYRIGTRRMRETVWRQREASIPLRELRPGELAYGISASRGSATGAVKVVQTFADATRLGEGQFIVVIADYKKPVWDEILARMDNVLGVISATGSETSHPAIVCREFRKPCIVGVSGILGAVRDGQVISMTIGADDNSISNANAA